ncbi:MAG TPA: AMP-binding protein, partial [Vicinamibacterales bacterium]|nr:AMP-binding protein [Vicinamibacterales bacterium]
MIFRAPVPPLTIPEVALTPFLLERAADRGEKPAFIDGPSGRILTYRGLGEAVRRSAAGLAARGFRKSDVFAIYSPNLPEYAVAFHAVSLLGGVNTTVSPLYTVAELRTQLEDAGARYLVTVPPCVGKAAEAARGTGVRELFVFGEAEGAVPFASLAAGDGAP